MYFVPSRACIRPGIHNLLGHRLRVFFDALSVARYNILRLWSTQGGIARETGAAAMDTPKMAQAVLPAIVASDLHNQTSDNDRIHMQQSPGEPLAS